MLLGLECHLLNLSKHDGLLIGDRRAPFPERLIVICAFLKALMYEMALEVFEIISVSEQKERVTIPKHWSLQMTKCV